MSFNSMHTAWLDRDSDAYERDCPADYSYVKCEVCRSEDVKYLVDNDLYSCEDCCDAIVKQVQQDNPHDAIMVKQL